MDRLDAMAAFVAVADLSGFAAAARSLRLSPPTVTRLVAALEARLATRLLQRTTRSVTLTDSGARFLVRARSILADVADAEGAALAEQSVPTGRFVVTAPSAFGRLHVAPLMCAFLARHRAVVGELILSDAVVNLVEAGIDAAVRIGHLADSSLVARRIGATRRVVVGSPGYLRRGRPRAPADLASHRIIQFTALTPSPEWHFSVKGRDLRVPFSPIFRTNSADAAIGHAELGGGLTMVLAYQAAESLRAGRLRVVLPELEPPAVPIHIVYPSTRLLSAKVKAFVELALGTCDWHYLDF